jgi:hypothetical protein
MSRKTILCVIILAEDHRPDGRMLDAAWETNDDGAGIAWREPARDGSKEPNGDPVLEVVWKKGLGLKDVKDLCDFVPLPYVVHFRSASQGGVFANLTHPFEVSEEASDDLNGRTKNPVLFHNGTWGFWPEKSMEASVRSGVNVPLGMWSDSRAMAWLSSPSICGYGFMNFLPEHRGVIFAPTWMNVFRGPGWVAVKDAHDHEFWCSNDRSWKGTNVNPNWQPGQHLGHHTPYRPPSSTHTDGPKDGMKACAYGQCKSTQNLDSAGYCQDHVGGRERKADASILAARRGAASNETPFLLDGPVRLITLNEVEDLFKADRISKNLLKALTNVFDRVTNPRLTEKQRAKAQKGLEMASRSLIGSGRLPLTDPSTSAA